MALDTRLAIAVTSSVWSPSTRYPVGASVVIAMSALSAATLYRDSASATTVSTSTASRSGQLLGALQPRQLDQLADHVAQPVRLGEHLLAEPAHRLGVVGRFQQRLGEHPHRADRRLEFVADVGDEVAAGRLHPGVLGLVVDVDHREPAVLFGQQSHVAADRQSRAAGVSALARRQVDLAVLARGQRPFAPPARRGRRASRSRTRPSSRARSLMIDHVAVSVDDDDPHWRHATRCGASICDTVMPDCSAARRCLRSIRRGASRAPSATPITSASSADEPPPEAPPIPHSRENRTHSVNVIPAACGQIGTSHKRESQEVRTPAFTC